MRSLMVWNLVTLDGYFEGPKSWDIDWHNYVWGDELERISLEQLKTAGMLLFGRVTYAGMADYWKTAGGGVADLMNAIPKIVFSRSLEKAGWNNTRLVKLNAADEIVRLKQESGKDMFIFGSARLVSTLMPLGLIDEYRLGVVPIILGGGNPMFKPGSDRINLELLEARPLVSGCVILRYRPARRP